MKKYNPVTDSVIAELKNIVGEANVSVDEKKLKDYSHDEVLDPHYIFMPEVVVFPENPEQIAMIMQLANRRMIPVVPRGAGTGLSCGATPVYGGIVLTTDKLNKIIKVDADNLYIEAEAGVLTGDIQNAAKEIGLYYPGDPCSGDSCYIGGNVATNAGGNKAVKYGTTRHQVYSIEVVTPMGEITTLGGRLAKCSTGYPLEQLIMGSEGTLGIITKVTLKLVPLPPSVVDLLAIFPDYESAISTVSKVIRAGVKPTCVEFMDNRAVKCVERYLKEALPHSDDGNYLIIQVEAENDEELENKAATIDEVCTENNAIEVLMPESEKIWKTRKSMAEALRHESLVQSNEDAVVPLDQLPFVMKTMVEICEKYHAVARVASHAGDGNIHLCIMPGSIPEDQWEETLAKIHDEIYAVVYPLGGRLSGEHGIGYKKKKLLEKYTNSTELTLMRAVKKAFDPNLILNPGKLFDVQ